MELNIQEYHELATENTIDDAGVIRDVAILGLVSRNKRTYTQQALQEAVALYDNAPLYADHSNGSRRVSEKLGKIANVAFNEEKQQLRGDLYVLQSHELYGRLQEDLSRSLGLYGLSHDAQVSGERTEAGITINKINLVRSVDLVGRPATTVSLKEEEIAEPVDINKEVSERIQEAINGLNIQALVDEAIADVVEKRLAEVGKTDYNTEIVENKPPVDVVPSGTAGRKFLLSL